MKTSRSRNSRQDETLQAPAEPAAADVVTDPEPLAPLGDDAAPEDIAAAATRMRSEAAADQDAAEEARAGAEALMAEARAGADKILSAAGAKARALTEDAGRRERLAGTLGERARLLERAADAQRQADEAHQHAAELEDEREQQVALAAELDGRLAALRSQRAETERRLAEARDAGDIVAVAAARALLAAIEDQAELLASMRASRDARIEAIGDGTLLPVWPQKEWYAAREVARQHHNTVRRILNAAFPERREAVHDARKAWERQVDGREAAIQAENRRREAQRPVTVVTR